MTIQTNMHGERHVIIGAGMGGIAAALRLVHEGHDVCVVEKADAPGGKMRTVQAGSSAINAGPTVMTMKWVFDSLLEGQGVTVDDLIGIRPMRILARHAWSDGTLFDLHANVDQAESVVSAVFGDTNARGFRRFVHDSRAIFQTLKDSYIAGQRPGPVDLMQRIGLSNLQSMLALKPFLTLWGALGNYFPDARLQQLFARYATYCGSSPFSAPATLMLVAHVEQDGVWMVDGGMAGLAKALSARAAMLGARFMYGSGVSRIETSGDRAIAVHLATGERLAADQIIYNGDVSALAGLVDPEGVAPGTAQVAPKHRSLSALTYCLEVEPQAFPLAHHTVFFSDDYAGEFRSIFRDRRIPAVPTTYICAQDRADDGALGDVARERLLCLINAPANGDDTRMSDKEMERCRNAMKALLQRCSMVINEDNMAEVATTPSMFARLFPGSGGALYGRASHGWLASFQREGARTALSNLYLAGGSVHPGPGVPMAALSGMLAVEALEADRALTRRFHKVAISGGISTG